MASWVSGYPFVGKLWCELLKEFLDTYRPELHYMRGRGPRWLEKHDAASLHSGGTQAGAKDVSARWRSSYLRSSVDESCVGSGRGVPHRHAI
jgi:hypothetical protein